MDATYIRSANPDDNNNADPDLELIVGPTELDVMRGQYSIRDGDWKLIFPLMKKGPFVLYDLKNDIKETNNVASEHPEREQKMTALLKTYVENGRSTPGPKQKNFENKSSWLGLPS